MYTNSRCDSLKKRVLLVALLLAIAFATTKVKCSPTATLNCIALVECNTICPVQLNQVFTINITVVGVTGVCSWQIELGFNSTVLKCTEARIPEDNIFAGKTNVVDPIIDNVHGSVLHGFVFFPVEPEDAFNGSGVLCQIDFNATSLGEADLTFLGVEGYIDTFLLDFDEDPIPFTISSVSSVTVVPEFLPLLIPVLFLSLTFVAFLFATKLRRSRVIQPKTK